MFDILRYSKNAILFRQLTIHKKENSRSYIENWKSSSEPALSDDELNFGLLVMTG